MHHYRMARLTIMVKEGDTWHHRPLHSEIVHRAQQFGLAGATVVRGIEGFGIHQTIHTNRILSFSSSLPLMIIIIDLDERIRQFITQLDLLAEKGIAIVDEVEVITSRTFRTEQI